jgi:glutamate transport system permease protein
MSSIETDASRTTARRRVTARPSTASVLYDAPGPRTRRITFWTSLVVGIALVAAGWWFVYRPLAAQGQFTMRLWGPLIDPDHRNFGQLWRLLGRGLVATLKAAGLAIVTSLICGLLLAVLRLQLKQLSTRRWVHLPRPVARTIRGLSWTLNGITRVCVEVLRGMPLVITIFFVARGLPELGVPVGNILWFLVIGLTLYNMVVIAEIVRSGMEGLPAGQREAALSIGLSPTQATVFVLLPQAVRIMLPAIISQLVVVLKDTSLGFIITYPELLHLGKTAVLNLRNPLQMYIVIGLIFLIINYTLSKLADWTERRLARRQAWGQTRATGGGATGTGVGPVVRGLDMGHGGA